MNKVDQFKKEWGFILEEARTTFERVCGDIQSEEVYELNHCISEMDVYCRSILNNHGQALEDNKNFKYSTQLMKDFFHEAPIGYIILDFNGVIEDVNLAASKYWKMNYNRMKGLGLFGLVASDFVGPLSKSIESAKISGFRKTVELKCVRPGGENFWGRFDIIKPQDYLETEERLLCSITDITVDKILDEAIKKTAIGLSNSVEGSFFSQLTKFLTSYTGVDYAIISKYSKRHFETISVSKKNRDIENFSYLGHKLNHGTDKKDYRLNTKTHKADSLNSFFDTQDTIGVFLFDNERKVMGEIILLSHSKFEQRQLFSSILEIVNNRASVELLRYKAKQELDRYRDELESLIRKRTKELEHNNQKLILEIEKRKQIEEDLREKTTQANEANIIKTSFLANMSHEIRTPMNGILGIASLMEQDCSKEKIYEYIRIIKDSGHSLLHIINDILDISKLESGKIELEKKDFNLRSLLNDICKIHQSNIIDNNNVLLFIEYPSNLPVHFNSDVVRIRQVLDNLISNALKFTKKGHVIIRVDYSENTELKIEVEDSGIGLTQKQQESIFERFTQADSSTTREFGGTGLGLSISKKITDLLEGSITCMSKKQKGTTFSFSFPVLASSEEHSSKAKKLEGKFHLNIKNSTIKKSIKKILQLRGMKSITLKNLELESTPDKVLIINDNDNVIDLPNTINLFFSNVDESVLENTKRSSSSKIISNSYTVSNFIKELGSVNTISSPSSTKRSKKRDNKDLKNLRILLAEDNEINRIVARDFLLSLYGVQVDLAEDGRQAVQLCKKHAYDIIFMDCLMPIMDGFEATKAIKAFKVKKAPFIIALTANAMKGDREKCLDLGFDEYLSKPLQTNALENILNRFVH